MTAAATRSIRHRGAAPAAPSGAASSAAPEAEAAPADAPRLRLAAARGALGLELDAPFGMRPLRLTGLSIVFPNIRFPIDLTGGVTRFRHRRGVLARLELDVAPTDLAAWAAPRLRGLLGSGTPDVWLSAIEGGLAVGLADGEAALAFDVLVLPSGAGLTFVPERARGIGLGAPPQALALRALAAALGSHARVDGGGFPLPDAAGALLRAALPPAGARAPALAGAAWDVPRVEGDRLTLAALADAPPPALPDRLVRAGETLLLTAEAEEAAYRGDEQVARDFYLLALERAPRHPEISERLAWLDLVAGDRPEAALSTLIDVAPAVDAGLLGAELLAAVGDGDGARGALARAARAEPFAPLAARAWLRAAALAEDLRERLGALDEAVTRAPALADARWARLSARLSAADPRAALADAQHLEAAARGARARHDIARRAARAFLEEGFSAEAHRLFERALRYVPDDAEAVAGLARALAAQGASRRALDLFSRALALAERAAAAKGPGHEGTSTSAVTVDLARALVDVAADRPAAIARVRSVPASAPEAAEARLLEARWRAELGDLAGAGLAIGRLRDHAERDPLFTGAAPAPGTAAAARAEALAALLIEAAQIDERFRDDLAGAQRDLGLALRLLPRDARLAAAFRRVARENARRAGGAPPPTGSAPAMPPPPRRAAAALRGPAAPPPARASEYPEPIATEADLDLPAPPAPAPPAARPRPAPAKRPSTLPQPAEPLPHVADLPPAAPPHVELVASDDPDADEALADRLADRVRASPHDRAAVLALCDVLERLGRDLELFALLSARMDEGDADEVAALAPRRRTVLARLAARARAAGSASEAELYEMMLAAEA
jgi:tetratricopeptide (TPR) repeat protein